MVPSTYTPLRLIVVDDHGMFLDSVVRVLEDEPDLEVVGRATTLADAYELIQNVRPDVIVLDSLLPDGMGVVAARRINSEPEAPAIVFVTGFPDLPTVRGALDAGRAAVVSKDRGTEELLHAIRSGARGTTYTAVPAETLLAAPESRGLSEREIEVLRCMAEGLSTEQISTALFISRNTVRSHVQRVLDKLHVHSKLEAVALARRERML